MIITGDSYSRRCRSCLKSISYGLPKLERKLIYLDQFVISDMMKAFNPRAKANREGRVLPFWASLYRQLERLRALQLISCPTSEMHERESAVHPLHEDLRQVYEHLSGGVSFRNGEWIRTGQISRQVLQWIRGGDCGAVEGERRRVLHGTPTEWQDVYRVSVTMTRSPEYVNERRRTRAREAGEIQLLFTRWRKESASGKKFVEFFREEARGYVMGALARHVELQSRIAQVGLGNPIPREVFEPDEMLNTARTVLDALEHTGVPKKDLWRRAVEYAESDVVESIPFIRIGAAMWATLATQAQSRGKLEGKGLFNDMRVISTLLPYCDAMFIDKQCSNLFKSIPRPHRPTYTCRVYSSANKDEFLAYLHEIETNASPEHRAMAEAVYGKPGSADGSFLFKSGRDHNP